MQLLKNNILFFDVFITGTCVLIIEVVAFRVLSPYFGNTIFSASSVIGIILAALSMGYYIGGTLADKRPSFNLFNTIILLGGLSTLLLHILNIFLLPSIGHKFSIVMGPLITAPILFFLPAVLLGMLSPFAIKLQSSIDSGSGVGKSAGKVFFWSTVGSIFGSFLAGFVLIPRFGIDRILVGTGVVLIALGLVSLAMSGISKKKIKKITVAVSVLILVSIGSTTLNQYASQAETLYANDGVYERLIIYDGVRNGEPTRFFQQDRSSSGAMLLNSDELAYTYTKYYELYKVFKPDISSALFIGGGAYSMPKALLKEVPDVYIDVAEIEPSLFDLGKKYFNVPNSPQIVNHVKDGRRFLYDTERKYDLIYSDVYHSIYSIPAHFTTKEFFELAKSKMNEDGVFLANIIGSLSREEQSLVFSEIKTFQSVFPNSYFFATGSSNLTRNQNIVFAGYNNDKKISFDELEKLEGASEIFSGLKNKLINVDRFELSGYPILTDNYAPIEYLTAKNIKRVDAPVKIGKSDGAEMMSLIAQQLRYGPRFLSAPGHEHVQTFLSAEIKELAHEMHKQEWEHVSEEGTTNKLVNVIGRFFPDKKNRIILGTHYDSKKFANNDKSSPKSAVPGANDSASGVAVLLEVANYLSRVVLNVGVDVVFFDGEEGEENFSEWEPLGSTYFTEHLDDLYPEEKPMSGVVVDMVCDKDLVISKDPSSVQDVAEQVEAFWKIATKKNPDNFSSELGTQLRDDHTALNKAGIPTILLIDFKYEPFHTTGDTLDKCSASSLEIVADNLIEYINSL